MSEVTLQMVKDAVKYDAATGIFTWARSRKGVNAGDVAGNKAPTGYWRVQIMRHSRLAHRLAWFYVHGVWPKHDLDHVNGVRTDNRIANLREVTRSQNLQNRVVASRRSTSGLLGAHRSWGGWQARITIDGEVHHLGTFDTPEEAHRAYLEGKKSRHPFFNGERDT